MDSLSKFAQQKLAEIKTKSLYRETIPTRHKSQVMLERDGREYLSFSGNDYLGLSQHPDVVAAAIKAARDFGAGAGASRLVTGDHPLYQKLESEIAAFKEAEAALVFGSGYLTNLGVIPVLVGKKDLILADRLSHACLFAGSKLSKATLKIFRHNDMDHLRELLETERGKFQKTLILTDGVFSMDGVRAPVEDLSLLAREFDAWLMVDDAHGLGVVESGRGSSFKGGLKLDVPLQMGTLSKAVGAYGGYIAADAVVIDMIRNRARSFIYTTGLPPAAIGAARAGLKIISNNPALCKEPIKKATFFSKKLNLPRPKSSIVPIILGDNDKTLMAAETLAKAGYLVHPIRPPTVPEGTARLRFSFSAAHDNKDIINLVKVTRNL